MTMGITSPTSTTGQILKDGTAVISFDANNNATFAGTVVSNTPLGMRNRIINGAMDISQRNGTSSVTANDDVFILDRWITVATASSKMTGQQNAGSVTPPAGFTNYLGITSSSAYSVGASDIFAIRQKIEGYNVSDLDFGKSTAKTITFSFWVRSSLTGTFGGALMNSAGNRCYPFTYTISAANTWEYETITVTGDTSGTWLTTNGVGLSLVFNLGTGTTYSGTAGAWSSSLFYSATGATSVVGTNGATFYITGVQLEIGTSATPFERRLYNQELANCQRYFQKSYLQSTAVGTITTSNSVTWEAAATSNYNNVTVSFPVEMRTGATITLYGVTTGTTGTMYASGAERTSYSYSTSRSASLTIQNISINQASTIQAQYTASAEL